MASRLSAKAIGFDAAVKHLRDLPKTMRNRALRAGFRRIGQSTAKALKGLIPGRSKHRTGMTDKSIGFKVKLYRTSGRIVVAIGPRSGFSTEFKRTPRSTPRTHNPTRVFQFADSGKKGVSAKQYLRRAMSQVQAQYPGFIQQEVKKAVAAWQLKQSQS